MPQPNIHRKLSISSSLLKAASRLKIDTTTDEAHQKYEPVLNSTNSTFNGDSITKRNFATPEISEEHNKMNHISENPFALSNATALFSDAHKGLYSFFIFQASNSSNNHRSNLLPILSRSQNVTTALNKNSVDLSSFGTYNKTNI